MLSYSVIGIMSGTSMDGVDLAHCVFKLHDGKWNYRIDRAQTIVYDEKWRMRLSQLYRQSAQVYAKTDLYYGKYLGILINSFIEEQNLNPDFISSHGHTIFHQPEQGLTAQVGSGAAIYAETGIKTICDFRSVDVMLGGQGAPLVPIGDAILFNDYNACLNLGGIANIAYRLEDTHVAFDISPCNIILNRVARITGKSFDDGGQMASLGTIHSPLLNRLNALPYYEEIKPKTLGREWINTQFWPVVKEFPLAPNDLMATLSEHISEQLSKVILQSGAENILVTGGGALNHCLLESTREKTGKELVLPEPLLIHFKEALIFAFIGVLRIRQENNVLKEITGSRKSHIGGAIFG